MKKLELIESVVKKIFIDNNLKIITINNGINCQHSCCIEIIYEFSNDSIFDNNIGLEKINKKLKFLKPIIHNNVFELNTYVFKIMILNEILNKHNINSIKNNLIINKFNI